jgi:hypothetical protein
MKQYEVNVSARVDSVILIEAEDEEQACLLAEEDFADTYVLYNPDQDEYRSFSSIIGYEPTEV